MKAYRLFCLLCLLALIVLGGCAPRYYGPSPDGTYDHRGPRLDVKDAPNVETIIDNQSSVYLSADMEVHDSGKIEHLVGVPPKTTLTRNGPAYRRVKVTLRYMARGHRSVIGWTNEELKFEMPALYTGETIVITDDMLRGRLPMNGIIICQGDGTQYQDDRGNDIDMRNGDRVEISMLSGDIVLKLRSLRDPEYFGTRTIPSFIDLETEEYEVIGPDGKKHKYDFRIIVDEQWRRLW